jgi:hypothetical protein
MLQLVRKPMLLSELFLHTLESRATTTHMDHITYMNYLRDKYPMMDWDDVEIPLIKFETKKAVVDVVNIFEGKNRKEKRAQLVEKNGRKYMESIAIAA